MARVLVTGADGFIGSHLVEHLVAQGWEVRALVQYNSFGQIGWLRNCPQATLDAIEVVAGDIRDPVLVGDMVQGMEVVFHLAALISIPYSYQAASSFLEVNAGGTLHVLEAAKRWQPGQVLLTSTSEVYGTAMYHPMDESHPLQAQSPYSASKIAADALGTAYHRSYGVPVTIMRPFNTFGPRQSRRAVIPAIITQLLRKPASLKLGDLRPTRDFTYVKDTVAAMAQLGNRTEGIGQVVNIASQQEVSIGALAQTLIDLIHPHTHIVEDTDRLRPAASEVMRLHGDASNLRQLTGWSPRFTFAEGLQETIAWFSQAENLAHYPPGNYMK